MINYLPEAWGPEAEIYIRRRLKQGRGCGSSTKLPVREQLVTEKSDHFLTGRRRNEGALGKLYIGCGPTSSERIYVQTQNHQRDLQEQEIKPYIKELNEELWIP